MELVSPTPTNNTYLSANTFIVNVTHTEIHPDRIVFYLSGNSPQISAYSGSSTAFTTPALSDGVYTYYVWVNDTAGNTNQTETRTITIDTTPPTTTPTAVDNTGSNYNFNTWTGSTYVNVTLSCDDGSGSGLSLIHI